MKNKSLKLALMSLLLFFSLTACAVLGFNKPISAEAASTDHGTIVMEVGDKIDGDVLKTLGYIDEGSVSIIGTISGSSYVGYELKVDGTSVKSFSIGSVSASISTSSITPANGQTYTYEITKYNLTSTGSILKKWTKTQDTSFGTVTGTFTVEILEDGSILLLNR